MCVVCVELIQSKESRNIALQKKAISLILKKAPINRFKLAVLLGMNARSYSTFHPFLREAYDHVVRYDDDLKVWTKAPIEKPVVEEEEIETEDEGIIDENET